MKWKPMTTAPKDGRYIFVMDEGSIEIVRHDPERIFYDPEGKEQNWIKLPAWVVQWDTALRQEPDCWMPLPTKTDKRWQPFNTAPKDGREILCLDRGKVYIIAYTKDEFVFPDEDGTEEHWYWWDYADDDHGEATHWMPLPETPK